MDFAHFTNGQFEFLLSARCRPEQFVRSSRHPSTGLIEPGFESLEACQTEDRQRAAALRALVAQHRGKKGRSRAAKFPPLPGDPIELAATLDSLANGTLINPPRCGLASAIYMHHRRIGLLGTIVELVTKHRDLEAAWLSCTSPDFRFDQNSGWSDCCKMARSQLEQQLDAAGVLNAPGLLIGFMHGYYVPNLQQFQLRYRGFIAGAKLQCLRKQRAANSGKPPLIDLRLRLHPIRDLRQQINQLLPNCPLELEAPSNGKAASVSRMREPALSLYLLWLAQHRLSDLTTISGAYYYDGHLALQECYSPAITKLSHTTTRQEFTASSNKANGQTKSSPAHRP
jgi:hypothetical protein